MTTLDEWGYKLTEAGCTESHVFLGVYLCFPCFIQFGACISPWSNRMKLDTGEEFMECTRGNYVLTLVSIMNGH